MALEGLFISLSVAGGLEALGGWALPVIASAAKQSISPQDIPAKRASVPILNLKARDGAPAARVPGISERSVDFQEEQR